MKIHPDHYNNGQVTDAVSNHDVKNKLLRDKILGAERYILNKELQQEPCTIYDVKNFFKPQGTTGGDFYRFAEIVISDKKPVTKKRYSIEIAKIKSFAGETLKFGDVTPQWLTRYRKHLLKEGGRNKTANSSNTTINAFKVIRHVFNVANMPEHNVTKLYPFKDWTYPKYVRPKKKYLTLEECEKIYNLLHKKGVNDNIRLTAAFFLLESYAGIRFSDWQKFSVEKIVKGTDMVFTATKTGTDIRLPLDLMPSLKKILDYIQDNKLTFPYTLKFANDRLLSIEEITGIDKHLTTHVARHTCATQLLSIGLTREEIAIILGVSLKTVDTYAQVTDQKIRNAFTRVGGL